MEFIPQIPARSDALVEFADYRDEGCHLHPSCLACPLPQCIYDVVGGSARLRYLEVQSKVYELYNRGVSAPDIARHLYISRRTVYRHLAALR